MGMGCSGEVVIFVDTNVGTHIALAVSPDISAADFKRELERMHCSFFPTLGEIKAHGLMVRRKSWYYHLTESLPMKYVFQGIKKEWFLHVEVQSARHSDNPDLSHLASAKNDINFSDVSNVTGYFTSTVKSNKHSCNKQKINNALSMKPFAKILQKAKKGKRNKGSISFLENKLQNVELCVDINEEAADEERAVFEMSTEKVVPITGPSIATVKEGSNEVRPTIDVNRNSPELNSESKCRDAYNSEDALVAFDGELQKQLEAKRDDNYSSTHATYMSQIATRAPPRTLPSPLPNTDPGPGSSGYTREKTAAVGRRILIAANNIRISGNKRKPLTSLYRVRSAASKQSDSKISMFEMSDGDD